MGVPLSKPEHRKVQYARLEKVWRLFVYYHHNNAFSFLFLLCCSGPHRVTNTVKLINRQIHRHSVKAIAHNHYNHSTVDSGNTIGTF